MKLVATSDFRISDPSAIEVESESLHENHVHKGARFSIGGDLPFEKLPANAKKLVVELNVSGRIVSTDQTEKVKAIDAEVAQEAKAAKKATPEASGKK